MWFKKPRQKRFQNTPKWMVWGLSIFILIILYGNSFPPAPNEPSPIAKTIENVKQELPDIKTYESLMPSRQERQVTELKKGSGVPVLCGQEVKLAYRIPEAEEVSEEKQLHVHFIGTDMSDFLRIAILNGDIGSERRYGFPTQQSLHEMFPDAPAENVDAVDITIIQATPDYSKLFSDGESLNLQINDKKTGHGVGARCGDQVQLHLKLWNANGTKFYSSDINEPLIITIGGQQLMLGIEQGLIGMGIGSERILVVPPEWQITQSPEPAFPKELTEKQGSLIVAEIVRVQ